MEFVPKQSIMSPRGQQWREPADWVGTVNSTVQIVCSNLLNLYWKIKTLDLKVISVKKKHHRLIFSKILCLYDNSLGFFWFVFHWNIHLFFSVPFSGTLKAGQAVIHSALEPILSYFKLPSFLSFFLLHMNSRVMSWMSLFTHTANIRKASTCDVFLHVGNSLAEWRGVKAAPLYYWSSKQISSSQ